MDPTHYEPACRRSSAAGLAIILLAPHEETPGWKQDDAGLVRPDGATDEAIRAVEAELSLKERAAKADDDDVDDDDGG